MQPIFAFASRFLTGTATAVGAVGAGLTLIDVETGFRLACTLVFFLTAPAVPIAVMLGGLDVIARFVVAATGAVVVDAVVAETMLALNIWSIRGGVAAVAAITVVCLSAASFARRGSGGSSVVGAA